MKALICLLNYDGNPLIGLRIAGLGAPVCNVWGYDRADVLTRAFREVSATFLPLDPTIECVAFLAEDIAADEANALPVRQLVEAFRQTGLSMTAPIPAGESGWPAWQRHTVKAGKVTRKTPFFLQECGFLVCDRAQVERMAAHPVPLPAATAADPTAPDFEVCRRLGGLAPVRIVIHRPIRGQMRTCPELALSSAPLLVTGAPTEP